MLWLILLVVAAVYFYLKVIKPLSYWKERGIAYQKPWPIIGNMGPFVFRKTALNDLIKDLYNAFPDKRYNGTHGFTQPVLLIRDLDLIKQITVKDFDHFMDHNVFFSDETEPLLGKNLFALKGQHWRDMRCTLSPTFTSSKMRAMFGFLLECSEQFTQHFQRDGSETMAVEMKAMFTRFTTDAIASVAFGLKCDSLVERDNEFYLMGKEATNMTAVRQLKFFLAVHCPALTAFFKVSLFPQSVTDFFRRLVKENIRKREEEGLVRPDMIHLLMEARKGRLKHEDNPTVVDAGFATVEEFQTGKMENYQKRELTDDDITAQALIFFIAGFETSATLMSFIAYELAINPDIQQKLQTEIDDTMEKCDGKITYESLLGMKYLDMVVSETLRKWPPAIQLDRLCVKDYVIEAKDTNETPCLLEKGTVLQIPVYGIHRDTKYFPNPDKFDPERFNDENKHNIQPYSYIPFGAGPRNCIASRFALLENKTLVFHLLSLFNIVPVEKTPIPLKLSAKSLKVMPDEGFWLGLQQRKTVKIGN